MMQKLERTDDGLAFEDGVLTLRDGRELAWRWWGEPDGIPVLRFQGMPSSRLFRSPDPDIQRDLGVRFLQADRPGYGGSTRKPGRGIAEIADDYAQLLDKHGLDRVPAAGASGGGPHVLAFTARYPDRIKAATVLVGAAPLTPDEAAGLVELNAKAYLAKQRGWDDVFAVLSAAREEMLRDNGVLAGFKGAPASDEAVLARPAVQKVLAEDRTEALRQGAEGWADESFAMRGDWDFDPAAIRTTVTWWHGDGDRNAPLSAARRAVARIPNAQLRVWQGEGHLAVNAHEAEVLSELLSRS
jgi:pimeloyl-ACP methyl ester carboxylesterase